jgi:hypothetical protein
LSPEVSETSCHPAARIHHRDDAAASPPRHPNHVHPVRWLAAILARDTRRKASTIHLANVQHRPILARKGHLGPPLLESARAHSQPDGRSAGKSGYRTSDCTDHRIGHAAAFDHLLDPGRRLEARRNIAVSQGFQDRRYPGGEIVHLHERAKGLNRSCKSVRHVIL